MLKFILSSLLLFTVSCFTVSCKTTESATAAKNTSSLNASSTRGHQLDNLSHFKNSNIQDLSLDAEKIAKIYHKQFEGLGGDVVLSTYSIKKISPPQKPNETLPEMYLRILKFALHRDYPITGDDGGYWFDIIQSGDKVKKSLPNFLWKNDGDDNAELDALLKGFTPKLEQTVNEKIIAYMGGGSGNNTSAAILALVDIENNEFFYIMDSNFGSDN